METYAIQPILDRWRRDNPEHQPQECRCAIGGNCASMEALARHVGVSHSTMHRRITLGTLSFDEADRWACRLGVLPHTVWPHWGRALREECLS